MPKENNSSSVRTDSEQELRQILASIEDYAIFTMDLDGAITSWHIGAENLFGYTPAEILGEPSDILWTPEDRAAALPAIERLSAADEGIAEDNRWHQRNDGTRFYANGAMRPLRTPDGAVSGFTKICRDVTLQREREQQQEVLRNQVVAAGLSERDQLSQVFNESPAFMAVLCGPKHVFELANTRFYKLVGHRSLIGQTVQEALPEVNGQGFLEILDQVYFTGEPFIGKDVRIKLEREAGRPLEERYVEFVYQPTRDADGNITGIYVFGVDLTERKHQEHAVAELSRQLKEQTLLFDTALSNTLDFVYVFDLEGRFVYVNKSLLDLWGLALDQAVGKTFHQLAYPEPLATRLHEEIDKVIATKQVLLGETSYTNYEGREAVYEYMFCPVISEEGGVTAVVGTTHDITRRKHAEAELRAIQQQLEESLKAEQAARSETERASRIKDEFLATLSHELRTPLNAILGWAQVLRGNLKSPQELEQGLSTIERNARAQAQIIEDLLDMSRIISGKVRLEMQRLELANVIRASIETVQPAAQARGVHIETIIDSKASPVSGDPNRLQQVLWNLLTNAIKFTPREGQVQVVLARINSHLEVTISDTGEGIDPEFLPHVFDRFRQADASSTRKHGGLGLGLAIVKQLVELHGGTIGVASPGLGQGATFTIKLPFSVIQSAPVEARSHLHSTPAPLALPTPDLSLVGVKVLVVDDEADARDLIKRVLEEYHATVLVATSANAALTMLQAERPDILVSDIGMPDSDGYALIKKVRTLRPENGGNTPAIALTAYARAEDRMKAIFAGFQLHIVKPVEAAELLTMVASLARKTPGN